ncbi:MAG TPA: YggS family pyridoxal phosphate-dependent enzyme [Chitinophagaceae bacterium]|nr:YggS family pyridoxal phosphate-dependent enzyme [Chitinophagaceae bacterium]
MRRIQLGKVQFQNLPLPVNETAYHQLKAELDDRGVTLVAVSKTKPVEDILELYNLGHRDFGENYVQEMVEKAKQLPPDIRWHFIGHLQTNKVKLIAPYVQLIHGVDSLKLLKEINKEAEKSGKIINCLLQVYIAREETKFGMDEEELNDLVSRESTDRMRNIRIRGLMGMASFTDETDRIRQEFHYLKGLFDVHKSFSIQYNDFDILSMGMSGDYRIAIEEGCNMVRIGSLIFGERTKQI